MQPNSNNGKLQIRFTRFGYKYSLNKLGDYRDKQAYSEAIRICLALENDIKLGRFTCKDNQELFTAYHPLAKLSSHHELNSYAVDAITLINQFLDKKQFKDKVLIPVLTLLKSYGKQVKTKDDAFKFWQWFSNDGKRSNNSNNLYLATIKPVCPMFKGIKPLKASKVVKDEKPFTKDEIKRISDVFSTKYQDYLNFVHFLFATGVRPSEAIALTWDCVDFDAKTVTIKQAIGIANDGSKVTKETKTGVTRVIPISNRLYDSLSVSFQDWLINPINHSSECNSLVFSSPNGSLIDLGNFRARVWVKALQDANISYRTIYNTRHTFCSHFLNEQPDFIKLASITHGTKSGVQTLIKHYAHLVNKVELPDMW